MQKASFAALFIASSIAASALLPIGCGTGEADSLFSEGPPNRPDTTGSTSGAGENRGFFESLGDFFFPEEDRYAYAEGLSRGGYLLTVSGLSADQHETALDILDDEGAVDIDEREQSWRSEGWTGYQSGGSVAGATMGASMGAGTGASMDTGLDAGVSQTGFTENQASFAERDTSLSAGETVPVIEEQLRVGKRETSHGRVRVRSYVRETPVNEQVQLTEEHVTIERRPVDRAVTGTDAFVERTIEAEERGEEAVVSKEARVVEEIGLRKEVETEQRTISDTVRHTEVEIEDERTTGGSTGSTSTTRGGSDLIR